MTLQHSNFYKASSEAVLSAHPQMQNECDSGNPFFISMLKKAVTVKMRADVPTNLCTNQLKARSELGGRPPHPHDMAAANRTLSLDKNNKTSSALMNSFRHHDSVQIYLPLLATLLSKPSRNSERSASVAIPGFRIQQPQYPAQALLMPWSSGVWRSTSLNAHQSQSLTSAPIGVQSGFDLLQNAFQKTSSVCSWSGSPNVSFPSQHSCRFHQLESS